MAVGSELLEEVAAHMELWLGSYENARAAERKLVAIDLQRGEVEESLQVALESQSREENVVRGLLSEVEETPENLAEVESVLSPFLARAEFLQVVS